MDRGNTRMHDSNYSKPFFPPCLPSPTGKGPPSSSSFLSNSAVNAYDDDEQQPFPSTLSLPVLAPRAPSRHKTRREGVQETSASLMDFVNLMSITDVARACAAPTNTNSMTTTTQKKKSILLPTTAAAAAAMEPSSSSSSTAKILFKEDSLAGTTEKDSEKDSNETVPAAGEMNELDSTRNAFSRRASINHGPPPSMPQWSLTTPETMKCTISTPQAFRASSSISQKRKSPLVPYWHSTPVDGNRPLMLPSLGSFSSSSNNKNSNNNVPTSSSFSSFSCQQHEQQHPHHHHQQHQQPGAGSEAGGERSAKKAKSCSYKTLLSNAPMLPTSPDLEDRVMAAPTRRYHLPTVPCFSSPPPAGGSFTLVNPTYHHGVAGSSSSFSSTTTPLPTPPPPPPMPASRAMPPPPPDTAVAAAVAAAAAAAAGLPSLDDDEDDGSTPRTARGAPTKWLRMKSKKATSLLCALRLAAAAES